MEDFVDGSCGNEEFTSYMMYFAAEHGLITRSKKGRTYELSLP